MLGHLEDVVQEGFLCPICVQDFGSPDALQTHFEEKHTGSTTGGLYEERDVLDNIKDLFGRAKRKLIQEFEPPVSVTQSISQSVPQTQPSKTNTTNEQPQFEECNYACYEDPNYFQEYGVFRDSALLFKQTRERNAMRFSAENNKLIIRLNKLLADNAPVDPKARKEFEQSVTPWVADKDVPLCPGCGQNFGLRRRRHHCRLCGGIMCATCSHFMPYGYASIILRIFKESLTGRPEQEGSWSPPFPGAGFLQRSSSNSSLASLVGVGGSDAPTEAGDKHVRTCVDCRTMLERHERHQREHLADEVLLQLYEELRCLALDLETDIPEYQKIAYSIHIGDTNVNYQSAMDKNSDIMGRFQKMDNLSKRISQLQPNPESNVQLKVQQMIRCWTVQFVREGMPRVRALPSEERYTELVLARERRLKEERDRNQSAASAPVGSWIPASSAASSSSVDSTHPMLVQMDNIRGYVAQARAAGRRDEAAMLEDNLRELQLEYGRMVREERAAAQRSAVTELSSPEYKGVNPFDKGS